MFESNLNNKRIAKNTLLLYFRMILLLIINLYTSRVVLNVLGVDDYGIYNVVGGIVVILSFLKGALASGTQRFLNVQMGMQSQNGLNKVFSTSLQIHLLIALVILIIAETIGLWFLNTYMNIPTDRESATNWVYQFSIAAAIVSIFVTPYNATIISHEKMSAFAYISIIEAVLKLIVALVLIWSPFDKLIIYASLIFIISVVTCIIYVAYGMRHFEECTRPSFNIDRSTMKQMMSFSGWTVLGNLGYILHTQGIAILINMFFTVAVNAAQGIANQVNGVVTQFATNFLIALNPQVVKSYAAGEFEQMHSLIIRGCKMAFCLMSFFVIPLTLEAPTILKVWLGTVPEYSVIFTRLVLLISLVNSFSSLMSAAKGATGNIKTYQITLTIIGALHIPLAWLAFSMGAGPEYAMYIYLAIVIVLQINRILFVCKSVNLSVNRFMSEVVYRCITVLFISSFIPILLHLTLPTSILTTLVIGCVSTICVIFTTIFIALTASERKTILALIFSKLKK